jgi:hypothetical protein
MNARPVYATLLTWNRKERNLDGYDAMGRSLHRGASKGQREEIA